MVARCEIVAAEAEAAKAAIAKSVLVNIVQSESDGGRMRKVRRDKES